MQRARDEIGLHTHAWRWDDAAREWISDFADQNWIEHCVRQSFEHYPRCFNRPCRSFRFGDRWLNQQTAELIERLGARFDLTIEPGWKPEALLESFTGDQPDYSRAPRQPYHVFYATGHVAVPERTIDDPSQHREHIGPSRPCPQKRDSYGHLL
jgi:hypothetical protein